MDAQQMQHSSRPYLRLALMAALSFAAMYLLMYSMVNTPGNVVHNLNQVYMAGLMAAPMVVIGIALMRGMYRDQRLTLVAVVLSVLLFGVSLLAVRQQAGIGDDQFLRSMIPHHAGAILMCEQASISDAQILDLCTRIIQSQQSEIDEMRSIMERLSGE